MGCGLTSSTSVIRSVASAKDSHEPDTGTVSDREELYRNWLDWVTTNLGPDRQLAGLAATAATDAAERGNGFNAAVQAATAAWSEAAAIDHTRREGRAVVACVLGTAVWLWLIVIVVVPVPPRPANSDPVLSFGLVMTRVGLAVIPGLALGAIVCGHSARRRIKRFGLRGDFYATASLVLGYAAVLVALLGVAFLWLMSMVSAPMDIGF